MTIRNSRKCFFNGVAVKSLAIFGLATMFTACGDDALDEISSMKQDGIEIVSEEDDLPDCTKDNDGELMFIRSGSSLRVCSDKKWRAVTQNSDGSINFSCSTESLADSSGLKIICGGDSIGVVLNGVNGINGKNGEAVNGTNGQNGSSCTMVHLADSTGMKIVCGQDSMGVVYNGINGKNGEGCTAAVLDDLSGMKIICGNDSVGVVYNGKNGTNGTDGKNGADGASCLLKQLNTNSLRLVCGKDSATFTVNEALDLTLSSSAYSLASSSSSAINGIVKNRDELTLCDVSYKNIRIFVKQDTMYYTCDSVKWIPDSASAYLVKSASILGAAQKGPFKFGSPLELRELRLYNDSLRYSGIKYVDEISSNKGNFVIPKVNLVYPYAEIVVRGLWRNEVTGAYSTDSMTLQSLTDLSTRTEANANLLTHLEYARALRLVEKGYSVAAAKKQADYEIMNALGYATTIKFSEDLSIFEDYDDNLWYDAANATLLAMSILFMGNRTDAEILDAIETFRLDIADDGEWNAADAEKTKAEMADWAESFDKTIVRANVKNWNILEIPDYETYLDIYWNNVYGLGGCSEIRNGVVLPNSNKLSKKYNEYYICKSSYYKDSSKWVPATTFQKDTYQWTDGKKGEFKKGNVTDSIYGFDGSKWYFSERETEIGICETGNAGVVNKFENVYYICRNNAWTQATMLEYDTYGWKAGADGEVRAGNVNTDKYYVYEGEWRASTSEIENALGACVTSREGVVGKSGNTYYICKSQSWITATALEYDTYGWTAGTEGEVKVGSVNANNYYIYKDDKWLVASSIEKDLNGCTINREGVIGKSGSAYYICKSQSWITATALEYDTYGWIAGTEGEVKVGSVNADNYYIYKDDKWLVASSIEKDLNGCTSNREGIVGKSEETYYICKSKEWVEATALEYDTYGKICDTDGSIVDGEIISTNKYVCDAATFRAAKEQEIDLNKGCVSYTKGDVIKKHLSSTQDSIYLCSNSLWNATFVEYGILKDTRDNKVYKTVTIGSQIWMAENLDYSDSTSYPSMLKRNWCYENSLDSCAKYGRLYTWSAAMDSVGTFGTNGKGCGYYKNCSPTYPVRGICPTGWHLPSKAEFDTLFVAMGGGAAAGKFLKSTTGWNSDGNGMDTFGFSAVPAGYRGNGGGFGYLGVYAIFWSATNHNSDNAYIMALKNNYNGAGLIDSYKNFARSVRCLKNFK